MGGDLGPRVTFKAAQQILVERSDLSIQYYVSSLESTWLSAETSSPSFQKISSRFDIRYCDQVVDMTDKPSMALRRKQQSTMALALNSVATGDAHACVSCGNSGALLALSRYKLSTFIEIDRPAMARDIPTAGKSLLMLDLGANIDVSADGLYQFAILASAWRKAQGLKLPKLGLLNIGKEACKGTEEIRLAGQLIADIDDIDFVGFVEADELYCGELDIVVCDGFHGNIALKTSEGLMSHMAAQFDTVLASLLADSESTHSDAVNKALAEYKQKLNPVLHSGALMLGLDGIVIKSHGKSDQDAFYHSLTYALSVAESGIIDRLPDELDQLSL